MCLAKPISFCQCFESLFLNIDVTQEQINLSKEDICIQTWAIRLIYRVEIKNKQQQKLKLYKSEVLNTHFSWVTKITVNNNCLEAFTGFVLKRTFDFDLTSLGVNVEKIV